MVEILLPIVVTAYKVMAACWVCKSSACGSVRFDAWVACSVASDALMHGILWASMQDVFQSLPEMFLKHIYTRYSSLFLFLFRLHCLPDTSAYQIFKVTKALFHRFSLNKKRYYHCWYFWHDFLGNIFDMMVKQKRCSIFLLTHSSIFIQGSPCRV
jgi:hypothetical protein